MRIEKLNKKALVTMGLILFSWLFYFFMMKFEYKNDDAWFLHRIQKLYHYDVINFSVKRYELWTSRTLIEAVLVFLVQFPFLWKCVTAFAFSIASIVPSLIFQPLHKVDYRTLLLSYAFMWVIPMEVYKDAGWIATTTNYIIPYSAFLLLAYTFAKRFRGEKLSRNLYVFSLICLLYAANQEQLACVILGSLVLWSLYFMFYEKNTSKVRFALIPLVLSVLSFVNILVSPGNKVRTAAEIKRFFPNFSQMSLLTKLKLGISDTMNTLFFEANLPFLVLLVCLLITCLLLRKKLAAFFTIFPLFIVLKNWNPSREVLIFRHQADVAASKGVFLPATIFVFAIGSLCMIGILYFLFTDKMKSLFAILLMGIGVCTRLMIGFSPTIFASGKRTYFLMYMSFLFVILFIFVFQEKYRRPQSSLGENIV
ncbi:hypothetical protein [Streptococcus gallinaceus]|uniref:Multisubunit Na+/H+ antiporter MnhC subunit n=1 Tax=Streptococcus gallinaceus TaxID=165758 RepID=A0ABV2JJ40_9STRE